MINLQPLDKKVPISEQLSENESPVVLVNIFNVDTDDIPELLQAWENDANWMKKQPGYISTQLHSGIAGSTLFMNYAVWESVNDFSNAFNHPEFQSALQKYPNSTIASPHLFKKLAISNLCTK